MKVRPSVKPMCDKCKIIKRNGKVMVICSTSARSSRETAKLWLSAPSILTINKNRAETLAR